MTAIIIVFIAGYIAIMCEEIIRLNKAASALATGVLCWMLYFAGNVNREHANENLLMHMGEISSILFFLLGAMTIVEMIDTNGGFDILKNRIRTRKS